MRYLGNFIKIILIVFFLSATGLFIYAIFSKPILGEAYKGSFEVNDFSEGWTMKNPDGTVKENVAFPAGKESPPGQLIKFENTLPDDVGKGMRLCVRTALSDIKIVINGKLRTDYGKRNYLIRRVPISTSVIVNLCDEDAGGKIELLVTPYGKTRGAVNSVTYAYGNNVWFPYIKQNIPLVAMGILLIIAGVASLLSYFVFRRNRGVNKSLMWLGILTVEVGMWMLGENQLRQLIFGSPFYANVFVYLFIETVAGFGALYFDEIQDHRYNKSYTVLISILVIMVFVNSALNFLNITDYFFTLKYSHICSGLITLWVLITIIMDIRYRRIRDYRITCIGMIGFLMAW